MFGDGRQTRDYTYVVDVVAANLAAANAPDHVGGAFNIGRGEETSVLNLVAAFRTLEPDLDFEPVFAPARPGEVYRSALDPSLARTTLGWDARVSLGEGLRRTLAWVDEAAVGASAGTAGH